ncbi:hypothetical protein GCM10022297_01170 [Lactobacillus hamsteri]|uniref:HeH/LEM domain-containing protein n=1 Tax=Lactobacillus hamsteri DSM 5661 = JCM 6256 TaxID=1423754 RepID=A0A0R1Y4E9_9LACO|nr:hypothetical protein [Lactobacillus hamsteri]KRM37007.1 hypothetical protein FC39_GL000459 [Lactobacillus hamsteri DSM 5661 = JCM 6256]
MRVNPKDKEETSLNVEKADESTEENSKVEELPKPTKDSKISEIKAYLDAKGIDYTGKTLKDDLLALVK